MTGFVLARRGAAAGLVFLLAGCATVPAYERGNLAEPVMVAGTAPQIAALLDHMYHSKEATGGGDQIGGGGCGCN